MVQYAGFYIRTYKELDSVVTGLSGKITLSLAAIMASFV